MPTFTRPLTYTILLTSVIYICITNNLLSGSKMFTTFVTDGSQKLYGRKTQTFPCNGGALPESVC